MATMQELQQWLKLKKKNSAISRWRLAVAAMWNWNRFDGQSSYASTAYDDHHTSISQNCLCD